MNNRPEVKMRVFQSCNMADRLRTLRSCSIGINRFWFDGLVGLFRVLLEKNLFRLVRLINFFNQPPTRLKRLKKHDLRDYTA